MSIDVKLHHRTAYRYERDVSLGPQVIQLRPAPHCKTPIHDYVLKLTPAHHILHWQFDPLGNHLARVIFPGKTSELIVDVTLIADMTPINPFAFFLDPGFETFPFQYPAELAHNLEPYRSLEPVGPLLKDFLDEIPTAAENTVTFVGDVTERMRDRVSYTTRLEHGVQSCEQTLGERKGSCRDSAWLLVQVFRSFGLAARFVSGYLIQLASENPEDDDAPHPEVDSADLHAWVEVFLPGAGWIGVDPTSGLFTGEGHIPLVCTPSPSQAAPIWGTVEPAKVEFSFSLTVERMNEAPSVTKPFSEEEWSKVRAVAHEVDRKLTEQDVRLTMGGEPTFVGIDEPESPQWSVEALGAIKRSRGLVLIRRLRERTAPGGLLHFGQGKWYPGEPLPRWAFQCISRVDGIPVWEDADLIAREDDQTSFALSDSLRFIQSLSERLQVTKESILAAFEPGDETAEPTGYILPLRRR
jgi:transglutaminase-like putative cysteine protease